VDESDQKKQKLNNSDKDDSESDSDDSVFNQKNKPAVKPELKSEAK